MVRVTISEDIRLTFQKNIFGGVGVKKRKRSKRGGGRGGAVSEKGKHEFSWGETILVDKRFGVNRRDLL